MHKTSSLFPFACANLAMELMPPDSLLLVIIAFIMLLVSFSCPGHTVSQPHNSSDMDSLVAFKSGVVDTHGVLAANWSTGTSFCSWVGVACSPRHRRVVRVDLSGFSLGGTVSPRIANLSFLSYLDLSNNSLAGPIPDAIGRLPRLANLYLNNNSLEGPIPSGIFNSTSLKEINLKYNLLTGTLPAAGGSFNLPGLEFISLAKNLLTGPIPTGFTRCSRLQVLKLSYNDFTGSIPPEFGNMTALTSLVLGSNHLTGTIPSSIGNLSRLNELSMSFNSIEGEIPDLSNLVGLQILNLGANRLTGSVPITLSNASELTKFQLGQNSLTGSLPATLANSWPLLEWFNIAANQLSGGFDFLTSLSNCRNLMLLEVGYMKMEGTLPDSVGNLSRSLKIFHAGGNRITGTIPPGLGNLSSLLDLELDNNKITGTFPSEITRLKRLQKLSLQDNTISGHIPSEIGLMSSLVTLHLGRNSLSGAIPDSVGNIGNLQHLDLSSNQLSSNIPSMLWSLAGLIELSLSENSLEGPLPEQVSNLKSLDKLTVSNNRLSGNIPDGIGDLQMLTVLDISNNSFRGQVPDSLGKLFEIKYLNLSYDFLSGVIPKSLANLSYLVSLDLSFNQLEGQIPQGRTFSNLSIPILKGNPALCGAPRLGFSACSSNSVNTTSKNRVLHLLKYVLPPIAFLVVVLSCSTLLLRTRWRNKACPVAQEACLDTLKVISHHQLVRATDNFSSSNLLGKGGVSSVYKACFEDGLLAAVKVFDLEVRESLKNFDAECSALRLIRHRNLVKVISACSNLDFKGLVLQYMPNGSLDKWLHTDNCCLNLLQRLSILEDVSMAIEYLHHHHPDIVLHCDLKPDNVLLDEDMIAHVGDFGIAKLLSGECTSILATSAPGTIGYMAPEYGSTGKASRKSDVYSFGILLLETFTNKRPGDPMFGGELSLRQWISDAYPSSLLEIVDSNLLREDSISKPQPEVIHAVHRCLTSIVELGLACSSYSPRERPLMSEVVPAIRKIKKDYLRSAVHMS